jgi:hypothetical protein
VSTEPCKVCNGSGEVGQYSILDCTQPGCNAAVERAALMEKIHAAPKMDEYDLAWFCYQAGKEAK